MLIHSIQCVVHTVSLLSEQSNGISEVRGSKFELRHDDDHSEKVETNVVLGSFDVSLVKTMPTGSASNQNTALACLRTVRVRMSSLEINQLTLHL